jgi:hypothetical protein
VPITSARLFELLRGATLISGASARNRAAPA